MVMFCFRKGAMDSIANVKQIHGVKFEYDRYLSLAI